jgi:hypothetical protein
MFYEVSVCAGFKHYRKTCLVETITQNKELSRRFETALILLAKRINAAVIIDLPPAV